MPVEGLAGLGIIPGLDAQASAFNQRAAGLRELSRRSSASRGRGRGTTQGQQQQFGSDDLLGLLQSGQPSDFETIGIDDPRAPGGRFLFRGNIETGEFDPFERAQISLPAGPIPQRGPLPEREPLGLPVRGGPTVESLPPADFAQLLQAREGDEPGRDFPSVPSSIIEGVIPDIPEDIADEVRRQLAALKADRAAKLPLLPEEDREFIEFGVRSGAIKNPADLFRALGNVRASARQRKLRDELQGQDKETKETNKFEKDLQSATERVARAMAKISAGPGTSREKAALARSLLARQEPRFRERLDTTFGGQLDIVEQGQPDAHELLGIVSGRGAKRLATQNEQIARKNFIEIVGQSGEDVIDLLLNVEASVREDIRGGADFSAATLQAFIDSVKDPESGISSIERTVFPPDMLEVLERIQEAHAPTSNAQVPEAGLQARRLVVLQILELLQSSLRQRPQDVTEEAGAFEFGRPTREIERGVTAAQQARGAGRAGTLRVGEIEQLAAEGGSPALRALLEAIRSPDVQQRRRARRLGQ